MSRRGGGPDGRSRIAAALTCAVVLVLGLPVSALGQTRYTVRPARTDSLVQLRVVTAFRGSPEGTTRFSLPSDRFGVSEMHRWIRDVVAAADIRLEEVEPGVYTARHPPGAEVEIAYTVAYDPEAAGFLPFGPSVGPDHFHFFGSQWMARVGEVDGPREIEVVFETEGWSGSVGSSYGLGAGPHRVEATDYDLDYSVIAGGEYRTARSTCRGRPVVTMIQGSFEVSDPEIFELTETIVCGQREAFEDFDRPFFTLFVAEREGLTAGAPLLHGFTTFLESDASPEDLRGLLAHEMIHTWLPRTARLVDPARPEASEAWARWFHEGFTEYLSRVVLVRQELAPGSWMVERTNRDLSRLAYHPYRTLTLEELEEAAEEGRYNNHHHRLHYLRGALLALNWNARIRAASGGDRSLLDAVRDVVARAQEEGGRVGLPDFMEVLGGYGVDARRDIERHLHGGRPLEPAGDAFGPGWDLGSRSAPDFEPGLDLVALIEESRVEGLVSGGSAERAGLREGMRVVDRANAEPWRGRWDPNQSTIVVVDEDGSHRRFEVRAAGDTMEIPEFTPTASRDRPTLFAPGVISTEEADDLHPTFTGDGRTLYFVRRVPDGRFTIMVSRLGDDGRWSEPRVAPFSGRYSDQEPFLSGDGRRLYFTSDRPVRGNESVEGRETWVVEWRGSGWGEPRRLEAPIRVPRRMAPADGEPGRFWGQARGPTEGPDGALYFWAERPASLGDTDIYRAPAGPMPGRFGEPKNLDHPVNTEHFETGAALAPDGCTLYFGRDDPAGFGRGDLFVSRRSESGWSEPENLGGSVNSDQFDFAPRVSPDGRRLYFSSNRSLEGEGRGSQNIYYVDLPRGRTGPGEPSTAECGIGPEDGERSLIPARQRPRTRFLDAARRVRSSTDSTRPDGGG